MNVFKDNKCSDQRTNISCKYFLVGDFRLPLSLTPSTFNNSVLSPVSSNSGLDFININTNIEDISVLDMDINNDKTCFIMQYLFLDRIEADLQQFADAWNNHKVSTN